MCAVCQEFLLLSYSDMLQKLNDDPLQMLNILLTKSNRHWLGNSNWFESIKNSYPALKIDNYLENKTNDKNQHATYYENNGMYIFSKSYLVKETYVFYTRFR